MTAVPEWALPLDVYLYFRDSRFVIRRTLIGGHLAIIDEPASGPAANVGYVTVWLDGKELTLTSPHLRHDQLVDLASTIIAALQSPGLAE